MKKTSFLKNHTADLATVIFGVFFIAILPVIIRAQNGDGTPPSLLEKRPASVVTKKKSRTAAIKRNVISRSKKSAQSRSKNDDLPYPYWDCNRDGCNPGPAYIWADPDDDESLDVILKEGLIENDDGEYSLMPGYKWADEDPDNPDSIDAVPDFVKISQIQYQENVLRNGQHGMLITTNFSVTNLSGTACKIWAEFKFRSGNKLQSFSNEYKTALGQLATGGNFTPTSNNQNYTNTGIFIPYSEFKLPSNQLQLLSFDLKISDRDEKFIVSSADHKFELCFDCK